MQLKPINPKIETTGAAGTAHEPAVNCPSFARQLPLYRRRRISVQSQRRDSCLTRRAMLAALREAELCEWLASGGDFLDRNYQPVR